MLQTLRIVNENRPARYKKAVFFGVDARFHPYALFVADQLARRCPKRDFDICIASAEALPAHPLWDQYGLRVCQLETGQLQNQVRSSAQISFATYLRLLAPLAWGTDYDRLLYLDADIFYQRGDVSRLLELDIGSRPLAAVRDMSQLRKPLRRHKSYRIMGLDYSKFFNAGVLLIDVPGFRAREIAGRSLDLAIRYADHPTSNDQSALNAVLHGNWAELSLVWNFQYSTQTLYFTGMFDVCLFHFISRRKPFAGPNGIFPRRITEEYRCFFEEFWPEKVSLVPDGLAVEQNRWLHFRALLFHLTSYRRFLRNEGRWRTDWDVH